MPSSACLHTTCVCVCVFPLCDQRGRHCSPSCAMRTSVEEGRCFSITVQICSHPQKHRMPKILDPPAAAAATTGGAGDAESAGVVTGEVMPLFVLCFFVVVECVPTCVGRAPPLDGGEPGGGRGVDNACIPLPLGVPACVAAAVVSGSGACCGDPSSASGNLRLGWTETSDERGVVLSRRSALPSRSNVGGGGGEPSCAAVVTTAALPVELPVATLPCLAVETSSLRSWPEIERTCGRRGLDVFEVELEARAARSLTQLKRLSFTRSPPPEERFGGSRDSAKVADAGRFSGNAAATATASVSAAGRRRCALADVGAGRGAAPDSVEECVELLSLSLSD